jgi:hypothetical protein
MKKLDETWLKKQIEKDNKEIQDYKNKLINDLKGFNKEELFKQNKTVQKISLIDKIFNLFK